jgi:hypothetical protein
MKINGAGGIPMNQEQNNNREKFFTGIRQTDATVETVAVELVEWIESQSRWTVKYSESLKGYISVFSPGGTEIFYLAANAGKFHEKPYLELKSFSDKEKLESILLEKLVPELPEYANYRKKMNNPKRKICAPWIELQWLKDGNALQKLQESMDAFYTDEFIGDEAHLKVIPETSQPMSVHKSGEENNAVTASKSDSSQNLILYGPPGTGKTHNLQKLFAEYADCYAFITFHQSYSYEEFIEGIRPVMDDSDDTGTEIAYKIEDGIFKKIAIRAINDPGHRYALFIDEINRGNISKIFGELITLVELDKRLGNENQLMVTLPYSKEQFGVPANLSIIGTMNTADRSIALVDIALRRRFDFEEMMPDYEVIAEKVGTINGFDVATLLHTINQRIEYLYDRDHVIGHAYLLGVTSFSDLRTVFLNKIIPLLQEYFYGDWKKVCLVLGCPVDENSTQNKPDSAVISAKTLGLGYEWDELEEKQTFMVNRLFKEATEADLNRFFDAVVRGPGAQA